MAQNPNAFKWLKRQGRRRIKCWMGRDLIFPIQHHRRTEFHGTEYGGWDIVTDDLSPETILYSVGVGDDISFDLSVIKKFGLTIHAFDPTPRSIAWVHEQSLPSQFIFHEMGLSDHDGYLTLFPPVKPAEMSFSLINRAKRGQVGVEVPVQRLSTVMQDLGHGRIDLLKLDIEGAEYDVLRTLADDKIYPAQVLVEFHHRFFSDGVARTRSAIQCLNELEYQLVAISGSGEEYTFMRTTRC